MEAMEENQISSSIRKITSTYFRHKRIVIGDLVDVEGVVPTAYADDLALVMGASSLENFQDKMREVCAAIGSMMEEMGLELAYQKTEGIFLKCPRKWQAPTVRMRGTNIRGQTNTQEAVQGISVTLAIDRMVEEKRSDTEASAGTSAGCEEAMSQKDDRNMAEKKRGVRRRRKLDETTYSQSDSLARMRSPKSRLLDDLNTYPT
ncbi:hypothetical protein HHI36_013288 [Cryptolaemus montrouzieri]|uniref:Reverse transcriptase domain-containing protein n=1 Tax=Cryptolaemus montrouzieri TaxID=559131 RepID=A0ABD2NHV0_9CUCU